MYIEYQVYPKLIDDNGNEQELPYYFITQSYTKQQDQRLVLENANKYVDLELAEGITAFEIISDEAVNVAFYNTAGSSLLFELEGVTNQIIKCGGFTNAVKLRNISGSTATILVRAFK